MKMNDKEVRELLAHFPAKISPEIHDFVTNTVLLNSRYIFTWRVGKIQFGYCTHCKMTFPTDRSTVSIEKYRTDGTIKRKALCHNESAICPKCSSECTVKSSGRSRSKLIDRAFLVYYEKSEISPNTIIARQFDVCRDYRKDFKKVKTQYEVEAYYVFDNSKGAKMMTVYSWRSYFNNRRNIKINMPKTVYCNYERHNGYYWMGYSRDSIVKAVKDTPFRWSGWENYDHKDMTEFFALFCRYPCVEYLTKLGFESVVNAKLSGKQTYGSINWNGKNIFKVLRLNKQELNEIKNSEYSATCWFLYIVNQNRINNWGFSLKEINDISAIYTYKGYLKQLTELTAYGSMRTVVKYINNQHRKYKKHFYSKTGVLDTWRDYLSDCKKLGSGLTDKRTVFPKDLYKAHQNTIKRIKYYEDKAMNEAIIIRLDGLKKYCVKAAGLLARPAASTKELIYEGESLNHCVGGYAKNYAEGRTIIIFIRKESCPEKPYYTMEVRDNRIIQVHGFDNSLPDDDVEAFLKVFEKKLQKQNDKERVKVTIPA